MFCSSGYVPNKDIFSPSPSPSLPPACLLAYSLSLSLHLHMNKTWCQEQSPIAAYTQVRSPEWPKHSFRIALRAKLDFCCCKANLAPCPRNEEPSRPLAGTPTGVTEAAEEVHRPVGRRREAHRVSRGRGGSGRGEGGPGGGGGVEAVEVVEVGWRRPRRAQGASEGDARGNIFTPKQPIFIAESHTQNSVKSPILAPTPTHRFRRSPRRGTSYRRAF